MSIRVVVGLPHSGKGVWLADRLLFVVRRNKRWYKKTGVRRLVYTNIELDPQFLEKNKDWIRYDRFLVQHLPLVTGADVFLDEMGIDFDATRWLELSLDIKAWLYAHEHVGCEVYGATQDFAQIDVSVRRLTSRLVYAQKLIGSRRPHPTKPPVKHPWGVLMYSTIPRKEYTKPANEYSDSARAFIAGEYIFITKRLTRVYNTTQHFEASAPSPLKHIERYCEVCKKVEVRHR